MMIRNFVGNFTLYNFPTVFSLPQAQLGLRIVSSMYLETRKKQKKTHFRHLTFNVLAYLGGTLMYETSFCREFYALQLPHGIFSSSSSIRAQNCLKYLKTRKD